MNPDPLDLIHERWREPGLVPGYALLNILGAGGQGLVFKARKEVIGRTYAIKFLRPSDPDRPTSWRSGEIDCLAPLANLRHPHLVAIEDRGECHGVPYLVMEFAGERSLKTLSAARAFGLEEALLWMSQTADAVRYLHDHGVLHLDVKPSNIYVLDGRVKLGDFGLVRLASQSGSVDLSLALGTPEYIAPEVISLQRASERSDVFGLGRTLDDLLISSAVHDDRPPPTWLSDLATESTALEPERRPSLKAFHERLASDRGMRKVRFKSLRTQNPSFRPLPKRG